MTNDELLNKINGLLKEDDLIKAISIDNVNYKPHPYCISDKHITGKYASLSDATIKSLEKESNGKIHCGMYVHSNGQYTNGYKQGWTPCTIPYEDHVSDTVCFVQLNKYITNDQAQEQFAKIKDLILTISGVAFIDTDEQFRVTDDTSPKD